MSASGSAEQPTLRAGAIGFVDALVIGLASTSPAYSLAAVIGAVTVAVGVHAPGALLASFVPMALIAVAFLHLNRVDADCGTTFSWVTRAMGPWWGWIGGWAIAMTGVLVVGSLADVGVGFSLRAVGAEAAAERDWVRMPLAVALIVVLAWVCVLGTELSARLQNALIVAQVVSLLVFAAVALGRALTGDTPPGVEPTTPTWAWLDPFGAGGTGLTTALLLGVFAYWGWESSVNLSEETVEAHRTPGRAALWSTVVLLVTYVAVAAAVVAFAGTRWLGEHADEEEDVFALLADLVLGPWGWVVLVSVATSAIASTQTTIIPASRTALSMARRHAVPASLARIHPEHRTPDVSTWLVAAVAIAWYVGVSLLSEDALVDSLTALSLLIAFYYALTGVACAVQFRDRLLRSPRDLLSLGIAPLTGAGLLTWLLVLSVRDLADPAASAGGTPWLGVGPPLVIGVAIMASGVLLMLVWRRHDRRYWQEPVPTGPPARLR